ncbi:MAG: DsrE family protein [Synergistetes bacterium]|nr:DsrE family protein [Synergistota bacterium]
MRRLGEKTITIISRHSPMGTSTVHEAFRASIGCSSENKNINLVLVEDSVFALLKPIKDRNPIDIPSLERYFLSLQEFGINLLIHKPSFKERINPDKDELLPYGKLISDKELTQLIRKSDSILLF